jgi:raffinose/stachyose/melibiose transport system permease protein
MKYALPALLLFAVFFIVPNIASFVLGFTDWTIFFFDDIKFNGLENFRRLFAEDNFWLCVKNTFFFAIVTVLGKNILGFILALIVQDKSKYNSFVRAAIFVPITISSLVVAIIFQSIYNPTNGLLNGILEAIGLGMLKQDWLFDMKLSMKSICAMEIWQQTGFCMCIYLAGLQAIPAEYYEAASIDGASKLRQIWTITLPLIVQSVTVSVMLSVISGIKVFEQVYGTTNGGPADSTQVLSTYLYKSFGNGFLGYSSAVGLFTTILIIALTFGLTAFLRKREVEM